MKKIKLTEEKYALVDDEDYNWLLNYKWIAKKDKTIIRKDKYYAICDLGNRKGRKRAYLQMSRRIMSLHEKLPKDMVVDHINGDTLDNRKINLRIITKRQNAQNRHDKTTSKYPGVHWNHQTKRWVSKITVNKKTIILGSFSSEKKAFEAYKIAIKKLGETVI